MFGATETFSRGARRDAAAGGGSSSLSVMAFLTGAWPAR